MADQEVIVEKKGGSKILLIVMLVLGLGLGGGGAYFYLTQMVEEEPVGETVDEEIVMMDVPIEGVRMPIFDNRGRYSGTIKIRVNLMVGAGEEFVLAKGFSSQLKHEFLSVLAKMDPPRGDNQSVNDPDHIASILLPVAREVLGELEVYELLVDDLQFESR